MTALEIVQIRTPFLAAAAAVGGVYFTVHQKDRSDRRGEWWRRFTWALERTESANDREAETGWIILGGLLDSDLATRTEGSIIEVMAQGAAVWDDWPHGRERSRR